MMCVPVRAYSVDLASISASAPYTDYSSKFHTSLMYPLVHSLMKVRQHRKHMERTTLRLEAFMCLGAHLHILTFLIHQLDIQNTNSTK